MQNSPRPCWLNEDIRRWISINTNESYTDPDGHESRSFAGLRVRTNMIPHVSLSIRLSSVINTKPIIFQACTAWYSLDRFDKNEQLMSAN